MFIQDNAQNVVLFDLHYITHLLLTKLVRNCSGIELITKT